MRVFRIIMVLVGVGFTAAGVYTVLEPPAGNDGVVQYVPAAVFFFIAVVNLVIGIFMLGGLDHGSVLRNGEPATATIVDVNDTQSTLNEQPVFKFTLDVHKADGSTYRTTVKQVVSRTSLGVLQPGLVVPVKVHPRKPTKVAIDSNAEGSTPAMTPSLTMPVTAAATSVTGGIPPIAKVVSSADVVRDGIQATATIRSATAMGTLGQLKPDLADPSTANDPMVTMVLDVTARDGTLHTAQGIYRVPSKHLHRLAPGTTLPVAYLTHDPANATSIDWDRL